MSVKVWKADPTCHVPDLWFLSWSRAQPEGLGVRAGPQWETPCLPHLADLLERQAPQRRPQLMPRLGSGQVPGDPSLTSPLPLPVPLTAQGVSWIWQNPGPKALRPMCILPEISSIWFVFIYT